MNTIQSENEPPSLPSPRRAALVRLGVCLGGILLAVAAVSCATNRTLVAPPQIPGAKFTGSESCGECHAEIVKNFATADHARMKAPGANAVNVGCESCHGAGSIHKESGGAARTIVNPRKSPETCFQCHLDKRATFALPSHHPVIEGKVSCSDCHDPHKGPAVIGGRSSQIAEVNTCGKCHVAQRGPFVFEHEAIREGCSTCHQPHGSVNAKMLIDRNQTTCLKCHFQQQFVGGRIFIGARDHSGFLSRGTCWTAGCHEAIHGSQIGSSLRF